MDCPHCTKKLSSLNETNQIRHREACQKKHDHKSKRLTDFFACFSPSPNYSKSSSPINSPLSVWSGKYGCNINCDGRQSIIITLDASLDCLQCIVNSVNLSNVKSYWFSIRTDVATVVM